MGARKQNTLHPIRDEGLPPRYHPEFAFRSPGLRARAGCNGPSRRWLNLGRPGRV